MSNEIRIAGIVKESIVDGPGIRMVLFAQGCSHKCPGCHNPETHSFEDGKIVTTEWIIEQALKNPLLDGLTFSGGEPFEQAEAFSELADKAKEFGLNIMTYTGYTFEHLLENKSNKTGWSRLIDKTDIIVDGRFELQKKNFRLKFRGSENQRVIDVGKTLIKSEITLANI